MRRSYIRVTAVADTVRIVLVAHNPKNVRLPGRVRICVLTHIAVTPPLYVVPIRSSIPLGMSGKDSLHFQTGNSFPLKMCLLAFHLNSTMFHRQKALSVAFHHSLYFRRDCTAVNFATFLVYST